MDNASAGSDQRLTNRRLVVVAAMAATFLSAIDTSIVSTAMPTIAGQLDGFELYSWTFSAYLLTSTTTVPVYGRLADIYGRKPLFVASAALFVFGSALCGLAQDMPQLVAFRAVQGLGAGGILPVTFTILGDHFGVEERAKMSGLFSAVWGSSAVAGPTIGGLIVDYIDWRWVFYINLPFGAAATYLMWRHLHEAHRHHAQRVDYVGAVLLTVAVSGLLLVLRQAGESGGWLGTSTLALLAGVLVLLGAFLWQERRTPSPVLPLGIFRSRLVAVVTGAGALIGGVMFGVSSFVPLYVQGVLGRSAVQAGLAVAPFAIGWSGASIVAGRIIVRAGYRVSVVAGVISATLGTAELLLVAPQRGVGPAAVGAGLVGVGMGLSSTAMLISVQNSVDWSRRGVATAMVQFARTIGGAVGVAALGAILTTGMTARLPPADAQSADALLDEGSRAELTLAQTERIRDALDTSLHNVYVAMFVLALVAMVIIVMSFPRGSVSELQSAEGGMGSARASASD